MDAQAQYSFRTALVLYAVIAVGLTVKVLIIGPGQLPNAATAYLTWWVQQPQTAFESLSGWLALFATVFSVICAVAMLFFARWARPLFAACLALLLLSELFLNLPVLKTPDENFLDSFLGVLAGGIVVFSYFSKLAEAFGAKAA